jgi:hypothetical protein
VLLLAGCATQGNPPLKLTGAGVSTCIPNPKGDPAIVGVNFHNTLSSSVTVIGGTVAGSNLIPDQAWVLDPVDHDNSVNSGLTPYSQLRKWDTRRPVGKIRVNPGEWVQIAVSFSFIGHSAIGAEVDGLQATYRTTDGAVHTATSTTKARYSNTCGS